MTRCANPGIKHCYGNDPERPCDFHRAVYDEWAEQARGFQDWFDNLDAYHLRTFFGLERAALKEDQR